ncbi:unnamed protein product [Hermetia illucens]|uniref:Glycosyl transferase CAP10 domain-containing protein n=1 Tax=Hermetia illucens TaxID=343691 RepID=A0A7R8UE34_HERIL|nr:protein O-glucosyltransferase 2-like [Hermetia illucens]CAD7078874.1 unnamed protein product [Hermetia illucens]
MNECARTSIKLLILFILLKYGSSSKLVDPSKSLVWGPGLKPDKIVLPARYIFIHAVDRDGVRFRKSPPYAYQVFIEGQSGVGKCPATINFIDRGDGSAIVRYKIVRVCEKIELHIKYNGSHVAKSPYIIENTIYPEKCYCPQHLSTWLYNNECSNNDQRIELDLQPFKQVNFSNIRENLIKKYDMPGSVSICNYVVKNNEIYRKCYGKYVGYSMFMDATLLSLTRVVKLPDIEFFLNLGDWPLSKKGGHQRTSGPYPIISWCGSDDSYDIVLPTHDITEATLENMGRVMLDMISVQKEIYPWIEKKEKAFWRGRDSRYERLHLIELARKHPDLFNASITNFFFFRDREDEFGPTVKHISFLDFFKYKYQLNIDGTVAAYRLPYLLGGNSLVFKQNSPFYEHFYYKLVPNKHFVPFKRDLSDLVDKLRWAKAHDNRAKEIMETAREFVQDNLMPVNIYCYHVQLFNEWSKRLVSPVTVLPGMERVKQDVKCDCRESNHIAKDEL